MSDFSLRRHLLRDLREATWSPDTVWGFGLRAEGFLDMVSDLSNPMHGTVFLLQAQRESSTAKGLGFRVGP